MSYQCKQKGSGTSILNYFQAALGRPQEKHSPWITTATSHPAQDAPVSVKAPSTVAKVKRRRTRRELNRAKFGKVIVEKLFKCKSGHVVPKAHQADKCRCKSVANSWAAEHAVPKPSLTPNWVITQNRLTYHLGIFNKEVKSIDIERLLKEDQSDRGWQGNAKEPAAEPAAQEAMEAMEVTGCTPVQGKEAEALVQQPGCSTPDPKANGPQPATASDCVGQPHSARVPASHEPEAAIQVPSPTAARAAPIAELAQKLVKTLDTRGTFPGQNLLHQTQQQLLSILVEQHRGLPDTLVSTLRGQQECDAASHSMDTAGLNRASSSGMDPLDEIVIASKLLAPRDQLIEETFLPQACGFLTHPSPVMMNRLLYTRQTAAGFAGLRISGCVSAAPGLTEVWPQKVPDRGAFFPGGAFAIAAGSQAEEDPSFRHPGHQHPWLWKIPSDSETAKVSASIFQSPTIGKSPSEREWACRAGPAGRLNQDANQGKGLLPACPRRTFPNAAWLQFCSRSPPGQAHVASNPLAGIWEADQDSPARPPWESFPRAARGPGGWSPTRGEAEGWTGRGQPLEDIYNVSRHKSRSLGRNFLGMSATAGSRGQTWACGDDLPEVGGKVGEGLVHSRTQQIAFEGASSASDHHPLNPHPCSSLEEKFVCKVCPGQYDGLHCPSELHNLSVSPPHFPSKETADQWASDLDKQAILLHNREVHKENSGHYYAQSQASGTAAQGCHGVTERWPCPRLEAGYMSAKGALGEEALDRQTCFTGKGASTQLLGSVDYLQPKACLMPLSFYYPPSDALEWSNSPLPGWCGVPQGRTWESSSPEPWVFPRMKLY